MKDRPAAGFGLNTMRCSNCGADNPGGLKFCNHGVSSRYYYLREAQLITKLTDQCFGVLQIRGMTEPDTARCYSYLVYRFTKTFTYQGVKRSNFFQRCTMGAALIASIPLRMRSLSSALELTRMCRRKECALFPKRVSTKFSHEPCVGVCT